MVAEGLLQSTHPYVPALPRGTRLAGVIVQGLLYEVLEVVVWPHWWRPRPGVKRQTAHSFWTYHEDDALYRRKFALHLLSPKAHVSLTHLPRVRRFSGKRPGACKGFPGRQVSIGRALASLGRRGGSRSMASHSLGLFRFLSQRRSQHKPTATAQQQPARTGRKLQDKCHAERQGSR